MTEELGDLLHNKGAYDSLPDDLKKVIDDNSGIELSKKAGVLWDEDEASAREQAIEAGVEAVQLDEEQLAAWREATQPVLDSWVEEMDAKGLAGQEMLDRARELIEKHESDN